MTAPLVSGYGMYTQRDEGGNLAPYLPPFQAGGFVEYSHSSDEFQHQHLRHHFSNP